MSSMGEQKMESQANTANTDVASTMMGGVTQQVESSNTDGVQKKKRKPRKPPAVAWKKPKGMPKRPLSAYNLFFKVQREAIMSARANDKSEAALKRSKKETVGIGFANLARTIGDKWQSLDDADKSEYMEQAAKEKARYKQEMVVWRKKQKDEKERQANMPPATVAVAGNFHGGAIPAPQPSSQQSSMVGMMGRSFYDDSRIHPALWQAGAGGLQNRLQHHQTNGLLFGMQQPHQQSPMMHSYLQELADNTLLQRQQQQLQELQTRQLFLAGAFDPSPRPHNPFGDAATASYPETWFELPSAQQHHQHQQQLPPRQPLAVEGESNQQRLAPHNDGELQKLQLLQDQHLQELQGGGHLQGVDLDMLKEQGDLKKLSESAMLLKQSSTEAPPTTLSRGSAAAGGGNDNTQSLHTLASKLDNDTISFLTEFRFNNGNANNGIIINNSGTSGSSQQATTANFEDPRTKHHQMRNNN
ncbi:unnamed protein product [Cylindrotheca closterium]|uniref:HMG box domain-containing protein n=1 Tax=Cylindrotheca closterium TaxID=2856 RepID=A0AAD2FGZ9_9STRA|nr:unnamed protein product [Cylindrotheca closterium]